MSLCLACRFGRNCPYIEGAEDFIHIMLNEDKMLQKVQDQVDKYNKYIEKKYGFKGPLADKGLELGIEISHCEGFQRILT